MRVVVVGTGSIGGRYARLLTDLCELAVLDRDHEQACSVATATGARVLADINAVEDWGAEAIVIATPAGSHCDLARRFAGQVRLMLIEKPLSSSLVGLDNLSDELAASGTVARVVSNMRFHPGPATLHENLHRIGQVYCARAHFGQWLPSMRPNRDYRTMYCASATDGGGVLFDCIHELDYLAWMLGDITSFTARAERLSSLEIDGPDWSSLVLEHKSGSVSQVHLDFLQRYQRRGCELIGSRGTLLWTNEGTNPFSCQVRYFDADQEEWQTLLEEPEMQPDDMYCTMLDLFLAGDDECRLSTVEEAARVTRVAHDSGTMLISNRVDVTHE